MTPQEAQIIKDVFTRLKAATPVGADAEAAGLVEAQLAADRGAGLALVQALVMTDRQCGQLAQENQALKQRLQTLEAQGAQPAQGGLFGQPAPSAPQPGPWDRAPQAQPQPPAQQPGPWGGRPEQPQGGGFWSSALRTGAGVAGGLFAFEALKSVFGGSHGGGFGGLGGGYAGGGSGLFGQPTTVINETVVYEGDRNSGPVADAGYSSGGFLDDASYDGGGDFDDDNYA
jgi:uncharacterized protein